MDMNELKIRSKDTIGTVTLNSLFNTREGRERYQDIMLALTNRCSLPAVASVIGIHPNTLTLWIKKGKEDIRKWEEGDEKSLHQRFVEDVIRNTGIAVRNAELEVNGQDPKFFLQRGWARTLINDIYNMESDGSMNYNLDGTVGSGEDDSLSARNNITSEDHSSSRKALEEKKESQNNTLSVEALAAMRESGMDINDVVDRLLEEQRKQR